MKKKGFTLTELIGVIVILGIISMISFVVYTNLKTETEDILDEALETILSEAAKDYVYENENNKKDGDQYCVTLQELVDNNYLNEPLKYSNGKQVELTKIIKININDGKYVTQILDDEQCNEIR